MTYDPESIVQPQAVIYENSCDVQVRRNGDDGLFVKPSKLDTEGEFHLSVESLGKALAILGLNRADLFPDG